VAPALAGPDRRSHLPVRELPGSRRHSERDRDADARRRRRRHAVDALPAVRRDGPHPDLRRAATARAISTTSSTSTRPSRTTSPPTPATVAIAHIRRRARRTLLGGRRADPDPRDRGRIHSSGASATEIRRNVATLAGLGVAYVTVAHLFFRDVATNAPALPFLPDWLYNRVFPQGHDEGLTAIGREVVEAMVDEGILIDITHMRSQSIRDVLAQLDARDPEQADPGDRDPHGVSLRRPRVLLRRRHDHSASPSAAACSAASSAALHHQRAARTRSVKTFDGSVDALCRHIDKIHADGELRPHRDRLRSRRLHQARAARSRAHGTHGRSRARCARATGT
jgi:hypothetical protein